MKVLLHPAIDVYLVFGLDVEGEFEARAGYRNVPMDIHIENLPAMPTMLNPAASWLKIGKGEKFYEMNLEADLSGKFGIGAGVTMSLPKLSGGVEDSRTKSYFGLFFDSTVNAKGKISTKYESSGATSQTIKTEWYVEQDAYLEGDIRLNKGLMWNFRMDLDKWRYPEEGLGQWDTTFTHQAIYPQCVAVAPEHGSISLPPTVSFIWVVPEPGIWDAQAEFTGLSFDLYASTDKKKVEESDPSALIAVGLQDTHYSYGIADATATWYWKIVTRNAKQHSYESSVYRFDTGHDGLIVLNDPLRAFLKENFSALGEVVMDKDGYIYKTPSNIAALHALTELSINDSENKYRITDINNLLAEMPELTVLDCRSNSIRTLSLPNNLKLTSLICRDNQLTSIDLSNVPGLTSLSCSNNSNLTKLDITGCPELKALDAADCMLDSLDLRYQQKLQNLYLSGSNFSRLDISRCSSLIRLDVYSQHQELLTLRLLQSQNEKFALFKKHFNMRMDYVTLDPIVTDAAKEITSTSAVIPVTILVSNYLPMRGVLYSTDKEDPRFSDSQNAVVDTQTSAFEVTLENLSPDTEYYVRGFARNLNNFDTAYGNVIRFKTLPPEDVPGISISPEEYDFGKVSVGSSATQKFTVKNTGTAQLVFTAEAPKGSFSVVPDTEIALAPNEETVFAVQFAPASQDSFQSVITLRSNVPGDPLTFTVSGRGIWGASGNPGNDIPGAVDLGIACTRANGSQYKLLWAACNVGASQPSEQGSVFAWGETATKDTYSWDNYKWWVSGSKLTKYANSRYWAGEGNPDDKQILDKVDDVAYQTMGEGWRMPTVSELDALVQQCDHIYTEQNGTYGLLLTSKVNGNSIFLPKSPQTTSTYWSSTRTAYQPMNAYALVFTDMNTVTANDFIRRCTGGLVRAVYEGGDYPWTAVAGVSLDKKELRLCASETFPLTSKVSPADASNNTVNWSSSNERVAKVSTDGVITAVSAGRAVITVTTVDGDWSATCRVAVYNPSEPEYPVYTVPEAKDLGLSVSWASCNLGATNPEESGYFFMWGETVPRASSPAGYWWGPYYAIEKYCLLADYGKVDNLSRLEMSDDAARANLGGRWRMPTREEAMELVNNCTWTEATCNDVRGYTVTSKVNGNSIFLPVTTNLGSAGYYWLATLNPDYSDEGLALQFQFENKTYGWTAMSPRVGNYTRYSSFVIRPVFEK